MFGDNCSKHFPAQVVFRKSCFGMGNILTNFFYKLGTWLDTNRGGSVKFCQWPRLFFTLHFLCKVLGFDLAP